MSFGTKWAIRAAVFGLVLHLLLTSAIICVIILVAKKEFGVWKSLATIAPFSVHALEFLAAVSLLRTKRRTVQFIEKSAAWLTSVKYLSPFIVLEEGILLSWEFHLGIVAVVGLSYVLAMGLVTKCLRLKCASAEMQTEERMRVWFPNIESRAPVGSETGLVQACTPARLTSWENFEPLEWMEEPEDEGDEAFEEDFQLPSYEDALRLLLELPEAEGSTDRDENDLPPCYEDVLNTQSN